MAGSLGVGPRCEIGEIGTISAERTTTDSAGLCLRCRLRGGLMKQGRPLGRHLWDKSSNFFFAASLASFGFKDLLIKTLLLTFLNL